MILDQWSPAARADAPCCPTIATRPRRTLLGLLAAATVALAACGSDDASPDESTASTDAVVDTTAAAAAAGCAAPTGADPDADAFPVKVEPAYSTHWSVEYHGSYAVLSVPDSEHPDRGELHYVVVACGAPHPELSGDLADAAVFSAPVQRTAVNHNNALAMLEQIGVVPTIVGLSRSQMDLAGDPYVDGILRAANEPVAIAESGDEVDYEATLGVEPDVLFMAGYGSGYDSVSDATERGLPAVMVSNRIEPDPLGSAEWMKFVSVFYGQEQVANDRFAEIETAYEQAAATVAGTLPRDYSAAYLCIEPDNGCEFVYAHGANSLNGKMLATLGVSNPFAEGNEAPNGQTFDYEDTLGRAADIAFIVDYELPEAVEATLAGDSRFDGIAAFANGDYIAYVPENYAFCRFNLYVQVDIAITDFAIGMAPDLFPGRAGRCFAAPAS